MKILLIVYDNASHLHYFPQGIAYIAGAARAAGHDVRIWNQDVQHYANKELTNLLDRETFDVIGIGVIAGYYQYRRLKGLAKAIADCQQKPFLVLGGHGPTPDPAHFMGLTGADAVVMGEGEVTFVELLAALEDGRRSFADIDGLAWMQDGRCVINKPRALIQDLAEVAWPAYDLFPMDVYRLLPMPRAEATEFSLPVLSGRGCTFRCTFCYRMDTGFRPRPTEDVLDEVAFLMEKYRVSYIDFSDELLMSSKDRTIAFCQAILDRDLKFKWFCNGRLNYASPEVLAMMKKAGCVFINYGIESVDNTVLKNMRKALTYDQIIRGIEATRAEGISPGLNIIFGNKGDNLETLRKSVEFLKKYDDFAQLRTIRPVTPYPGSPLFEEAVATGKVKDCADFYDNKHVNSDLLAVNFTELDDDAFHEALRLANRELVSHHFNSKQESYLRQIDELYQQHNENFRGFRHT